MPLVDWDIRPPVWTAEDIPPPGTNSRGRLITFTDGANPIKTLRDMGSTWEEILSTPFPAVPVPPTDAPITSLLTKTGIADNVATPVFTVTTTNESGSTDGGALVCSMRALVGHAASSDSTTVAVKHWRGSFSRSLRNTGVGGNTAIENIFSGASNSATSSPTRDLGTITVTVAETSEYIQTVSFQIDLTGTDPTTATVTVLVEVLYTGFLTAPVIAAA